MNPELRRQFGKLFDGQHRQPSKDARAVFIDTLAVIEGKGASLDVVLYALSWAAEQAAADRVDAKRIKPGIRKARPRIERLVERTRRDLTALIALHQGANPEDLVADIDLPAPYRAALRQLAVDPLLASFRRASRRGSPARVWRRTADALLRDARVLAADRRDLLHQLRLIPNGQ